MTCKACETNLIKEHSLISKQRPTIKNGSRNIEPACGKCGRLIETDDIGNSIPSDSRVIFISGTAGAGKSAIGQYIEVKYGYLFIDGDAISYGYNKRIEKYKLLPRTEYLCHTEVLRILHIVLGLGYTRIIVSYVIECIDIPKYMDFTSKYGIAFLLRILVPGRNTCIKRDKLRRGWTAGIEYINKWYNEFEKLKIINPKICIDTTNEIIEETINNHFKKLLQ
jgi:hypothetical protein